MSENTPPQLSCVMTTYRRFTCVERSIAMFLAQDCPIPTELIILNTDDEYPLTLSPSLENRNISIWNNPIDQETGLAYTNTGAIRRDAVKLAHGEYYICWDDDDIFLPWNNRQCMDKVAGAKAWKPARSLWATGDRIEFARNTMEASVVIKVSEVTNGFRLHCGAEHLNWYMKMRDEIPRFEDDYDSVPAYCFNWSDPADIGGHKQSSTIDRTDNFEVHKQRTKDYAKRPLELIDIQPIYKRYLDFFRAHETEMHKESFDKYVRQYAL